MSASTLSAAVAPYGDTSTNWTAGVRRVGTFLMVSGLAFVVLALEAPNVLGMLYDLAASAGTVTDMRASTRFGAALFGALTFGWGVTLDQLGRGRDPGRACTVGMLAWFVVDSGASVVSGYGWNTVSNIGFAVIVLVLLRTGTTRS
jgi:hypothetical protein